MDIVAILIAIVAILGSIPVFTVAWLYRKKRVVPVGRRAFLAMGFGLLSIGAFYIGIVFITTAPHPALFVVYSRLLWSFIIMSSIGMAASVLLYKKAGNGDGGSEVGCK